MSNNKEIIKDERTAYVENASYSFGYKFLAFAILFDVAYRSFKLGEASWDLLAIVILSGFILTIYQAKNKILNKFWVKSAFIVFAISALISAVVGIIIAYLR